MYVLYETASGYSLFKAEGIEEIGRSMKEVQQDIHDLAKFGKRVSLKSFLPFRNAADALENINSIAEGQTHPTLRSFLELNLSKKSKKSRNTVLGVVDKNLAGSIKQELGIECISDESVGEIVRGLRFHGEKILKMLEKGDLSRARLGLGHSYSRGKVKFNINRSDDMIIQSISLCDQLDKDINLFSMRIRDWYSWHFPELGGLVGDHSMFAQLTVLIGDRTSMSAQTIDPMAELVQDRSLAESIYKASKSSMGTDISAIDMENIGHFAQRLVDLCNYRKNLGEYMSQRMGMVAPNLSALVGDTIGARLISRAGSLTNLSKFPASTVQVLGAEKALFRALKTRGKTPKYGLIFHSSFIGRAGQKNKGRISRYLANKCSIASRIDSFSDNPDGEFGKAMREQVEERLGFFDTGIQPKPNEEIMRQVMAKRIQEEPVQAETPQKRSKKSRAKSKKAK